MMERDALDLLREMSLEAAEVHREGEFAYAPVPYARIDASAPEPDPLHLRTLTGLRDYLRENRDGLDPAQALVSVDGPTEVSVRSTLQSPWAQRFRYVRCRADLPDPLAEGRKMGQEEFVTHVQSRVADAGDRARVLKLAGNLKAEDVRTDADDGVTQEVAVRSGVTVLNMEEVPNPVLLSPWRTFHEVEQPPSPYVFRVSRGPGGEPLLALHEAHGGAWTAEAVRRVAAWLREELSDQWQVIS